MLLCSAVQNSFWLHMLFMSFYRYFFLNFNVLLDLNLTVTRSPKQQIEPSDMFTRAIWDIPLDTKMPDLKLFQLTKDMVKHRAKDNIIIVTFGNHAFMDFIVNWIKHLTDLDITNLLVGELATL